MPTETQEQTQEHILQDRTIEISRNGNHKYWLPNRKTRKDKKCRVMMSGVTSLLEALDPPFGAGKGWAIKQARLAGGDLDAPNRVTREATESGNRLHKQIHEYIADGIVAEEDDAFMLWFTEIGKHHTWLASERFLYHPDYGFGGTVDAFSGGDHGVTLWDWKSKTQEQVNVIKNGGAYPKDIAQASAYTHALRSMKSQLSPTEAKIAYIARDASDLVVVDVDLAYGWELFKASLKIHTLLKVAK